MPAPYLEIRRSKINVGSERGECVALVSEFYVASALILFERHDPSYRYWVVPFEFKGAV